MNGISHILDLTDGYAAAYGLRDVTVSSRVFGDSGKIAALRSGADITLRRYNATIEWFATHWPDATPWPPGVPRPGPAA